MKYHIRKDRDHSVPRFLEFVELLEHEGPRALQFDAQIERQLRLLRNARSLIATLLFGFSAIVFGALVVAGGLFNIGRFAPQLLIGSVCAFSLMQIDPDLTMRTAKRVSRAADRLTFIALWAGGLISLVCGIVGASLIASADHISLRRLWHLEGTTPAEVVVLGSAFSTASVAFLMISAQSRFTAYTGVTSFRPGSAFWVVTVLLVFVTTHVFAVGSIAISTGSVPAAVIASAVTTGATLVMHSLSQARRDINGAKTALVQRLDDLQAALRRGRERDVVVAALALNRAYSTRTAMQHPLLPTPMRTALDVAVAKATTVDLSEMPEWEQIVHPAVRGLTRADAVRLLLDACGTIRAALLRTRR
jgi:hypothetical protein